MKVINQTNGGHFRQTKWSFQAIELAICSEGSLSKASGQNKYLRRMNGWMRELNIAFDQIRPNRVAGTTVMR